MSSPGSKAGHCTSITLDPLTLRTPPADLQHIEPQQLALLAVVDDALQQLDREALFGDATDTSSATLQENRVGVFTGMGCASDACRWLLRERLASYFGNSVDKATLAALKDQVVAPMTAADVLGAMPNMPANRINAAYDFRGQGYSVSAEEFSDVVALQLGCEALRAHDIDLAVISAADFASEPARMSALSLLAAQNADGSNVNESCHRYTEKACALLLMRESTAASFDMTILGSIDQTVEEDASTNDRVLSSTPYESLIENVYGTAPIADTLFSMAVATALASRGQQVIRQSTEPRMSLNDSHRLQFKPITRSTSPSASMLCWNLALAPARASPDPLRPAPYLFYASADSDKQLCRLIEERSPGGTGERRVAVVAESQLQLNERLHQAVAALSSTAATPATDGRLDPGQR